jgi:hypothetical protein
MVCEGGGGADVPFYSWHLKKDDIRVGLVLFIALFSNKKRPLGVLANGSYILSMGALFTVITLQ